MRPEPDQIQFVLICRRPPQTDASHEFGLQDREEVLLEGVVQEDGSLLFEFSLDVAFDDEHSLRWSGMYVYGSADARFLYLTLREKQDSRRLVVRRMKILVSDIPWDLAQSAVNHGEVLYGAVSGEGSGTIPMLEGGWRLGLPS